MAKAPFGVAREGKIWLAIFASAALLLLWFSALVAGISLLVGVALALFFRIPHRVAPSEQGILLSPADGRVVGVDKLEHSPYVEGPCQRVSIFLSVFDVHMNYAPADGVIDWLDYKPGRFRMAFADKASDDNENQRIGIRSSLGKILVRQIAGAIARRIVLYKGIADEVRSGERIGMIKFGSRVEIYVPPNIALQTRVGDRVQGGLTVLGRQA